MSLDNSKLIIRQAKLSDAEFIATTIIEAEKSGTDNLGSANYFEITEEEYKYYLVQMLKEEVDGCEISLSSFVVAEYDGEPVAARGGWLECDNEDNMPSAILKSNLYGYVLPKENLLKGAEKYDIVKDIQIEREPGTYQLENSFTIADFRGNHIMEKLDKFHIDKAKEKGVTKIQAHVFLNNVQSLRACERSGFSVVKQFVSAHPLTKILYPDNTMVLLERYL